MQNCNLKLAWVFDQAFRLCDIAYNTQEGIYF